MELGDLVMVLPTHSIKFGGRWGEIVGIDDLAQMPFMIRFTEGGLPYCFSINELMDEQTYSQYLSKFSFAVTIVTGEKVRIKKVASQHEVHTSGGVFQARSLLPITKCRSCNSNTTGIIADFCEYCEYPIPN